MHAFCYVKKKEWGGAFRNEDSVKGTATVIVISIFINIISCTPVRVLYYVLFVPFYSYLLLYA